MSMMNLGQKMYFQEHEDIENALNGNSMSIEHVGSISVQGLCAKPILVIILFSAKREQIRFLRKNSRTEHMEICAELCRCKVLGGDRNI